MKGFCLYASFLSWLYLCLLFSIFHSVIPNICISETFHSYRTKVTKSIDCHAIMWKKMYLYSRIMAKCHGCSEMDWLYMVCRGVLSQTGKVSGRRCHIDYVVLVSWYGHDIVDPVPPDCRRLDILYGHYPCSAGGAFPFLSFQVHGKASGRDLRKAFPQKDGKAVIGDMGCDNRHILPWGAVDGTFRTLEYWISSVNTPMFHHLKFKSRFRSCSVYSCFLIRFSVYLISFRKIACHNPYFPI